ncbi:MAG: hypothetical protein ASARMPREDX12_005923 [Alectoria sarmentosa]|nr:MAG: hypothetical protein ASARMPREDX12_005923 [Alectoria sarmentosa]
MATANLDTSLPRALDHPDVVMCDPAETILQDTVPVIAESNLSRTGQIVVAAAESQKSSSGSSSFSYQSETSTLAHEQTPFVDFKLQVVELCHLLWPPVSRGDQSEQCRGGSGHRFSGLLKSRKLGRLSSSSRVAPEETPEHITKEFVIERMTGGTFNRIIGITIIDPNADCPEKLILRVPRIAWMSRPDRDVATLHYVRQHSSIPVADVKAFDFHCENPLKDPYVVQRRIAGTDLRTAIQNDLSHEQWCTVAREVGRIMLQFQEMSNPVPGLIEDVTKEDGVQAFTVNPFDIKPPFEKDSTLKRRSPLYDADNSRALEYYQKSTLDFFLAQFGRWRAEELRIDPTEILHPHFMERLAVTASQMNRMGCLGDNKNCLSHLDLAPRNIMVEVRSDISITITGVLDFDSAVFAPTFVSCYPPWWLWQDETQPGDPLEDESQSDEAPADPELAEIKRIFEETVGNDFLRYAYRPQFRLARKLFKIACHGNRSNESWKKIEEFLDEWDAFYKAEVEDCNSQEDHSLSSKASEDYQDTQEQREF